MVMKLVGARVKRAEDPKLVTGHGTYTDDIRLPGMLYMAVLRSPYAHARIRRIDASRALEHPGVVAVLTGEEAQGAVKAPLPVSSPFEGMRTAYRYPLAVGKARLVGDPVVALVAEDRYTARDALELVEVDYEPLPAAVDPQASARRGAPLVHEELKSNLAYRQKASRGDVEGAFREADGTVRLRLVEQRLVPVALECRAVVAHYDAGSGVLTLWCTTQMPHMLRNSLAEMLGLPQNRVHVIAPDVGGGFGSKIDVYQEEVLASLFSIRLGRPVKWAEERRENFVATIHGRGQVQEVEAAYKRDGTITALRVRIWADLGAYCQTFTHAIPTLTPTMLCGVYRIPNIAWELYGVYTNKTPTDAYRGAGRPEAAYLIERTVSAVAHRLGMDPAEVRRRNFIPPEAFPYRMPTGVTYDSGNYALALDRALELANYDALRREQGERLRRGDRHLLGVGLAVFTEICGFGPGDPEVARVEVEPDGSVAVYHGSSPHGQGDNTAFAQIVAQELGIPMDRVRVVSGDTDAVPTGSGTQGSRTLSVAGNAVLTATRRVREKALRWAAYILRMPPDRVHLQDGRFYAEDIPDRYLTWTDVTEVAYAPPADAPPDLDPGLVATAYFNPSNFNFPFGAHIAVVEVDRETGDVRLRDYYAVDDCGNRINPLLVEGQIHGGVAQGVAQALWEGVEYDAEGQLLTATLMDYAIPAAPYLPMFTLGETVTPTPVNPLGAKGIGELGAIGATPTVVNAVADALAPLGVRPEEVQMPLRPEAVWRLIQRAARRRRKG